MFGVIVMLHNLDSSLPMFSVANVWLAFMFFFENKIFLLAHLPWKLNLWSLYKISKHKSLDQQWPDPGEAPVRTFKVFGDLI